MRNLTKVGILLAALFALAAFGAGTASAKFTAAVKGDTITGNATATQVFVTNGGKVECTTAETMGTLASLESGEQHVTVHYTGCKAFGVATVDISDATYLFTTNLAEPTKNQVHILNTITIRVTKTLFTGECTVTVAPQTVGTVHYRNELNGEGFPNGNVIVEPTVEGITYTSSGGVCGTSGANGTYSGTSTIMGEKGQIAVDD